MFHGGCGGERKRESVNSNNIFNKFVVGAHLQIKMTCSNNLLILW